MELDVLLLGTDTTGKVIMEQTKTVVLSRHGAGIVSRYRFSPDDVLTLSLPGAAKEAEIRLLGQIGVEPGRYIYGVTFVDPDPHFWPMDFPEPESFEPGSPPMMLECSRCQARESIQQHEIEEDVYSVNGYLLRPCAVCGTATHWKKAESNSLPDPSSVSPKPAQTPSEFKPDNPDKREFSPVAVPSSNGSPVRTSLTGAQASPPTSFFKSDLRLPAASLAPSFEPGLGGAPATASSARSSSYSGSSAVREFASLSEIQANTQTSETQGSASVASTPTITTTIAVAVLPPLEPAALASRSVPSAGTLFSSIPLGTSTRELDAQGRPVNKRRHLRIRVSFAACVRHPAHADELVECENVSKGGACFHSVRQYALDSTIEIAAPFSPGETALFVPAKIKRVEALSGGQVFRYGVEYIKP